MTESTLILFTCFTSVCSLFAVVKAYEEHTHNRTTKRRMNQASTQFNLGYRVYQQKGQWFVSYRGVTRQFDQDEIVLKRGEQ